MAYDRAARRLRLKADDRATLDLEGQTSTAEMEAFAEGEGMQPPKKKRKILVKQQCSVALEFHLAGGFDTYLELCRDISGRLHLCNQHRDIIHLAPAVVPCASRVVDQRSATEVCPS